MSTVRSVSNYFGYYKSKSNATFMQRAVYREAFDIMPLKMLNGRISPCVRCTVNSYI